MDKVHTVSSELSLKHLFESLLKICQVICQEEFMWDKNKNKTPLK